MYMYIHVKVSPASFEITGISLQPTCIYMNIKDVHVHVYAYTNVHVKVSHSNMVADISAFTSHILKETMFV